MPSDERMNFLSVFSQHLIAIKGGIKVLYLGMVISRVNRATGRRECRTKPNKTPLVRASLAQTRGLLMA